jgi:hypothetical protein
VPLTVQHRSSTVQFAGDSSKKKEKKKKKRKKKKKKKEEEALAGMARRGVRTHGLAAACPL